MKKLLKKKHFIGVDISNNTLDMALLEEETYGSFQDKQIENNFTGFDKIIKWLKKEDRDIEDCVFCMEHTGTYGLLFFAWLSQMGIDYCVEPALQISRSLGITRGKDDKIDARRIADYALTNRAKLKTFNLPSTKLIQLKQMLTYRDQIVKLKTSLSNSMHSHKQYQKLSGLKITEQIQGQIEEHNERIEAIEKQIIDLIKSDSEMKKNYDLATSVKGIGLVIAAFMMVSTNNFTSFENGRKYACYAGIAPFGYYSGTSIKGKSKVSKIGNKQIKTLLSNGANSASNWDPQIKAYYNKKIAEGKDHKLVINSISCKLVNRVFAVIKRQSPYVNIYEQNFS
jgi:transposase